MTQQELQTKFDNLLKACLGKPVETIDPTNLDQCFDWAVRWCMELGFKNTLFSGLLYAKQIWSPSTQIAHDNFDYIPNSPTAVPQKGDIVVFDGPVGHVSVATGKGDTNTFESSDQNWNGKLFIQLVTHNYDDPKVLGWLRLKNITQSQTMQIDPEEFKRLISKLDLQDKLIAEFNEYKVTREAYVKQLEKAVNDKDAQIIGQKQNLDALDKLYKDSSAKLAECESKCEQLPYRVVTSPPVIQDRQCTNPVMETFRKLIFYFDSILTK